MNARIFSQVLCAFVFQGSNEHIFHFKVHSLLYKKILKLSTLDSIVMLSTETFLSQGGKYLNRGGFIDVLNIGHFPHIYRIFSQLVTDFDRKFPTL